MAKSRTKVEREHDLQVEADLYLKGQSFRAISVYMNDQYGRKINHVTVFNDIKFVITEWEHSRNAMIDHQKSIEIEKLNILERTYWDAWVKSQTDVIVFQTKKKGSPKMVDNIEKIEAEKSNPGDPRYLQGIERCIEQRCKILGLNAPKEIKGEISGNLFFDLMTKASATDENN